MRGLEGTEAEKIIESLDEQGLLFPQFCLWREDGRPKQIGRGAFSLVYEMCDRENPARRYALKVIGLGRQTVTREAFARTTQLQRALSQSCPYVARILDTLELLLSVDADGKPAEVRAPQGERWEEDGILLQFLLMDRLESVLVRDKYGRPSLAVEELGEEAGFFKFAEEIGQAMLAAHDRNILHRDIKLENIFRDPEDGRYKLGDFGIAKYVEGGSAETVVYTDGYGAPEIECRLEENYNAAADIYSFGITLYLLLNRLRFPGAEGYYASALQYTEDFVFPMPENASPELMRVIRKMCSFRREDRYQSMREVLPAFHQASGEAAVVQEGGSFPDLETEVYREETTGETTGTEKETRQERKQRQALEKEYYASGSFGYLVGISLLSAIFLRCLQGDAGEFLCGPLVVAAAAVLAEAVFLRVREFQLVFGAAAGLIVVYSLVSAGPQPSGVLLLLGLLSGEAVLAAAAAIGTGLWMGAALLDGPRWLELADRWDIGWIILILLLFCVDRYLFLGGWTGRIGMRKLVLWSRVWDIVPPLVLVAGIVLLLLRSRAIELPEVVERLHLLRVGIALLLIKAYDYLGRDASDDHVSVDGG